MTDPRETLERMTKAAIMCWQEKYGKPCDESSEEDSDDVRRGIQAALRELVETVPDSHDVYDIWNTLLAITELEL